ncbi:protein gp37 [Roseiarcus fermentans]|uniref:Protein gp37 n=1 Tax=Roseiarcus fermentans TaxID=1473586 RepID=A0A366EHY9_9HYPH|nr:phage Gp37/Gp68 family protein [Roseiarcus fermentans]RBP01069.1 protein gp37 [Roseiarcus fermentans]
MADATAIEWADATWNPIVGCSVVSPGCANCYAMRQAARLLDGNPKTPHYEGTTRTVNGNPVWTGSVGLSDDALLDPLAWRKPRRVFVDSMGDLFHEAVPDAWIDLVFAVMALSPAHSFLVLTKRSRRMREWASGERDRMIARKCVDLWLDRKTAPGDDWPVETVGDIDRPDDLKLRAWPLPNVWLGVSAERQQEADARVPDLLATPAAVRFVSCEPLLGPVRLDRIGEDTDDFKDCGGHPDPHWPIDAVDTMWLDALRGRYDAEARNAGGERLGSVDVGLIHGGGTLDWVIAGGESGPGARPMHPDWARGLRDQCASAGVPFFFKQHGEWATVFDRDHDDPDWRRCGKVLHETPNGQWLNLAGGQGFHGDRVVRVNRLGKRRAGRALDGAEHSAFPL